MARLLYGNFDFEHELATPHYNRPKRLARLNAELTPCLIALAETGDQVWCPEPLREDYAAALSDAGLAAVTFRSPNEDCQVTPNAPVLLEPWGWSPAALHFAEQIGVEVPAVDLDAVRIANSREFSFAVEHDLDVAPPGTIRLESSRQLVDAIAQSASVWNRPAAEHRVVLKANFGMSGRERFVLRGDEALTPSVHGWINRRVEQSDAVFLEPWLDSLGEFSTHWEIAKPETMPNTGSGTAQAQYAPTSPVRWPSKAVGNRHSTGLEAHRTKDSAQLRDHWTQAVRSTVTATHGSASASGKRVRFVGQTQLLNTPHGQYSGSRVGVASTELPADETERLLSEITATAGQAAGFVSQTGYTGPLGIDAMIYRNADGDLRTRPVQDINARWSMGRIALTLQQRLAPEGCLSLLRIPTATPGTGSNLQNALTDDCRLIRLTPPAISGQPCSDALVALIAASPHELVAAEQQLINPLPG